MESKSVQELRNDFVRTFAESGVFLTSDDVDIIFNVYTNKASNILNQLEQEKTK